MTMPHSAPHLAFMHTAISLGNRQLGRVAPNPAVGCVLVKDGVVVGRGATQPGGRPHAETQAIAMAGDAAKGATAYVSLEPCAHHGNTAPCAAALIQAGIRTVVAAMEDPDPRVAGKGFAMLGAAGVEVITGVLASEAAWAHEGFIRRIREARPLFTLKMGTTLDGRIATQQGESQWITGETARAYAHQLRSSHDAIMVGIGTALADDPQLTCRLPGLEHTSPIRIVVDSKLRLSPSSKLVTTARQTPTWLLVGEGASNHRLYSEAGVTIIPTPCDRFGHISIPHAAHHLAEQGLTRVLVEGGAQLATAMLEADVIDRLEWVSAALLLGHSGLPAVRELAGITLNQAPRFHPIASRSLGEDRLVTYRRLR